MHTDTRFMVGGRVHDDRDAAARAARDISEQAQAADIADGRSPRDIDIDINVVEVLVDAFNVVSKRDGEIVVREVDEETAEAEARRLSGEQAELRRDTPIHPLIPDETATPPGEPPALVPHDPTPHPGYAVEPAPERIVDAEEA